jgi:hypothetical protein
MFRTDWPSVGEFTNTTEAELTSQRLSAEGIPNKIDTPGIPGLAVGPYQVRVRSDWHKRAQQLLSEPPLPEDELTELALKSGPVEDP